MRRTPVLVTVLVLLAAACGGDGGDDPTGPTGTGADTAPDAATEGAAPTTATEPTEDSNVSGPTGAFALIVAVDPEAGTVTLRNPHDEPIATGGLWVCNRPSYMELPDETIEPGETATFDIGAVGIAPSGGEVALYTGNGFSSADAIQDYVTWGGADAGRRSVAVEAGIWPDGGSIDNGGGAFEATVDEPDGPEDYAPSS